MSSAYKKGFIEAINGVLGILKNINSQKSEDDEEYLFAYEVQNIENKVLGLKISFFETYYENSDEPAGIEIDDTEKPPGNYDIKSQRYRCISISEKDKL